MHCNHAINMDMTAALGAICLAEAALEVFQQTVISRTVFWRATTGNIINVNAATSAGKRGTQIDPSITYSDNVYSALPHFVVIHTRRWKLQWKRWQGLAWHKNRHSLHKALVFAFGEVGDCLGLPLGGINYTSFLKGPLWSSQESTKRASSRGV